MFEAYQVKANETIEGIARNLGVDPNAIRQINGFDPNHRLTPGEVIVVPTSPQASQQAFTSYMVKAGDNLYNLAKQFNIPLDTLLQLNGLDKNDYIYPNQEILVPREDINFYITKEGSTLDDVAKALNADKQTVVKENKLIYLAPEQLFYAKKK